MVLILLCEYLPKQCLHSLNMNEFMKNIWFLRTSHQDMVLHNIIKQYFWLFYFSIVLTCSFHDIFSSNITPRNLTEDFLLIMLLPIFNSGIFKGNVSLAEFL